MLLNVATDLELVIEHILMSYVLLKMISTGLLPAYYWMKYVKLKNMGLGKHYNFKNRYIC